MSGGIDQLGNAQWLNEPDDWSLDDHALRFETGRETDFWRDTLYGFRHDNGHALMMPVDGDFTAFVTFDAVYETLYDQAGVMLRRDEEVWLKAGIELSDGIANMSTVVTRGASDWSILPLPQANGPQRLRLTRKGAAVVVQFRNDARRWQLMRLADFPAGGTFFVGPMACSPKRAGFRARFTEFRIEPAVAEPLHDESVAE